MGKTKKGPKKGTSDARKRTEPQKTLNPFEVHVNRQKFQVLGRKLKTDRGLPGVARAKALKKRKATLLQEYKLKDKTNKFLDRRIGERNSAMTVEDRMTARFTAERMRAQSKKEMFNLADDEVLTHRGQTLNEIEKFDDPRSDDDDDDAFNPLRSKGHLDAEFVKDAHFGGGLLSRANEDGSKSRKDLIEQLITESKRRKAEQQKAREQTLDLTEKLDTEWKDLLPVINAAPKAADVERPKPDSFDMLMRQLKFEATGKPTDKLKSEDQIAKEEKEKLEELEAARLRRMQGISDQPAEVVPTHRSADDLDDNFAMDTLSDNEEDDDGEEKMEHENDAGDSDQDDEGPDSDEDEEGDDDNEGDDEENDNGNEEDNDGESGDESESSDDDIDDLKYDSSDEESAFVPNGKKMSDAGEEDNSNTGKTSTKKTMTKREEESTNTHKKCNGEEQKSNVDKTLAIREDLKKRKELMEAARKELPYTFEVPDSYEELQKVMAGRSPEYQGVIVERMVKCTHPSLNKDNKEKLGHLFALLMQHLHDAAAADENENVCWSVLDRLVASLFDIAHWCPEKSAECIRQVLKEKQQEYQKKRKCFPGVDTLIFLKLISLLFPTSDFRHPVVTPALVFMGQILSRCRVESRQDVAKGLLLVSLFLEYTALSKRFSPESINFLRNILYLSTNLPSTQKVVTGAKLPAIRPIPPVKIFPSPCLSLHPTDRKKKSTRNNEPSDRLHASDLIGIEPVDDMFCVNSVYVSLRILSSMASQLTSLPACRPIFSHITPLLKTLLEEKWLPSKVTQEIQKLQELLQSINETPLKYLVATPKRPKALRLYEPKIEQVYTDGKQRRPVSREKQETQKLLHRVKREKKGALREIRKDRDFITKIRLKQQLKSDSERRAKVKEIYGDASNLQGEMKKLDRANKRKK